MEAAAWYDKSEHNRSVLGKILEHSLKAYNKELNSIIESELHFPNDNHLNMEGNIVAHYLR